MILAVGKAEVNLVAAGEFFGDFGAGDGFDGFLDVAVEVSAAGVLGFLPVQAFFGVGGVGLFEQVEEHEEHDVVVHGLFSGGCFLSGAVPPGTQCVAAGLGR